MKTISTKETTYEAPNLELLEVVAEQGFAASPDGWEEGNENWFE